MAVLVTGGAGHIGSNTAVVLHETDREVVVLDALSNWSSAAVDALRALTRPDLPFIEAEAGAPDVLTRRRRLTFRPMVELRVTEIGPLAEQRVYLDDELDRRFKPGLLEQTKALLVGDRTHACTRNDQLEPLTVYETIAGYL